MNDQPATQPTQQVTAQQWAIVELFGHSRIAGAVSEQSFGSGAIYSINWCDEPTARAAAAAIRHEPISTYTLREAFANLPANERTRLLGAPAVEAQATDQVF